MLAGDKMRSVSLYLNPQSGALHFTQCFERLQSGMRQRFSNVSRDRNVLNTFSVFWLAILIPWPPPLYAAKIMLRGQLSPSVQREEKRLSISPGVLAILFSFLLTRGYA